MNKVTKYLNQHIIGNVYDRPSILEAYSTDRSILKITPEYVTLPETTSDLRKLVSFINQLAARGMVIPLAIRGSGLDKTGGDLTSGMVVSTEKLNRIMEIDEHSRLVRVQAGVTLDQLNSALSLYNLILPVKAHPSQTISSLLANYPADPYTPHFKGLYYYLDRMEVILSSGDILQTGRHVARSLLKHNNNSEFIRSVNTQISTLVDNNAETLYNISKQHQNLTGYRGIIEVKNGARGFDLAPLFLGSQGTLGIISEIILRCDVARSEPKHLAVIFKNIRPAVEYLGSLARLNPLSADLYDLRILHQAFSHGKTAPTFANVPQSGFLAYVAFDDGQFQATRKIRRALQLAPSGVSQPIAENIDNTTDFERLENILSSFLNDDSRGEHICLIDDFSVPNSHLPAFLTALKALEAKMGIILPIYGSFSADAYSVWPDLQIDTLEGRHQALTCLREFSAILHAHKGTLTGGAPEGRTKAIITTPALPEAERLLYTDIKHILDPHGIFNPDIKLGVDLHHTIRHIRDLPNPGLISI